MKGRKFLLIGSLAALGAIVYSVLKRLCGVKEFCRDNTPHIDEDFHPDENPTPAVESPDVSHVTICNTKEAAVISVKERHYEASKTMEESLNTIFKEDDSDAIVTENSDTLAKTHDDLNDLLK